MKFMLVNPIYSNILMTKHSTTSNIDIMRKMSRLSSEQEDICNDCLCSNMNFPNCSECEHYKEAKSNEQI